MLNSGHLDELLAFLNPGRIDMLGLSSRVQLAYALTKKGSSAEAEKALLTSDGQVLNTKHPARRRRPTTIWRSLTLRSVRAMRPEPPLRANI